MPKRYTCGWQSHGSNHKCHSSPSTTSHTQLVMPATNHTPQCTHTMVHTHMVAWRVERADDHTVLTITPSIHPSHKLHHQPRVGKHPYSTLHPCRILAPLGKRAHDFAHHECLNNVLFCMPCHAIGLQSLLSTPMASTLRFIGSHSLPQPFRRHRVTVPTLILMETVWMTQCKQGTLG